MFIAYYYPQGFQSCVPGLYPRSSELSIGATPVGQRAPLAFTG